MPLGAKEDTAVFLRKIKKNHPSKINGNFIFPCNSAKPIPLVQGIGKQKYNMSQVIILNSFTNEIPYPTQCCGSGMFIPDPDFYLSRIQKQHKREG
jgi:hypothetical protein